MTSAGRAARIAVLVAAGLFAAFHLAFHVLALVESHALNYVEGFVLFDAVRLGRFENVYLDPSRLPFHVSVYPPVYPFLVGVLMRVFGLGLVPGRLVSLFAFALIVALLLRRVARDEGRGPAVFAAACLALLPAFHPWATLVKPDVFGIALAFGGLLVADTRERSVRRDAAAALLFALALFTRPTLVAAPLAAVVQRAIQGDRREALRLAFLVAVLVAVPALVLQAATGGLFAFHVIDANRNAWFAERALGFTGGFLRAHAVVAIAAGIGLASVKRGAWPVAATWAVLAWPAAMSVGKLGSDTNYFLEALVATAWLAARGARRLFEAGAASQAVLGGAFALQAVLGLSASIFTVEVARASRLSMDQAAAAIHAIPGEIASDEPALLVLDGRAPALHSFPMRQLAAQGRWDDAPLVAALSRHELAAVVVQTTPDWIVPQRYTDATLDALEAGYRPAFEFVHLGYRFVVYRPKPANAP
jgi:hypothetical protein